MPRKKNKSAVLQRVSERATKGQLPAKFDDYLLNQTPFSPVPGAESTRLPTENSTMADKTVIPAQKNESEIETKLTSMMERMFQKINERMDEQQTVIQKQIEEQCDYMQARFDIRIDNQHGELLSEMKEFCDVVNVNGKQVNLSQPECNKPQPVPVLNAAAHEFKPAFSQTHVPHNHNATPMPEMPSRYGAHRKVHDLPEFNGKPEDWPMFSIALKESTAAYGYTNLENLFRLQKSLKGEAKMCVQSMLIHPDNVQSIFEELEFRYGRSDQLAESQMSNIKNFPPIKDYDLKQLIEFSTHVRNLVVFLTSANQEQHLMNPLLLSEMVAKLPIERRLMWGEHLARTGESNSIKNFAYWLTNIARSASFVENIKPAQTDSRSFNKPQQPRHRTLHTSQPESNYPKCTFCKANHKIVQCSRFVELPVADRWNWVKKENVCFCCLHKGHRLSDCTYRKPCNVEACKLKHNSLLHETKKPSRPPPSSDVKNKTQETVLSLRETSQTVYYRILPVILFGSNNKKVHTYALLDEGSSATMMEASLAQELELKGKPDRITMKWFDESTYTRSSTVVNCLIQGVGHKNKKLKLNDVRALEDLNLPCQSVDPDDLKRKYPQLAEVPIERYSVAKPRLLIGLDNAYLGYPKQFVECQPKGPIAIETALGWVVYGPDDTAFKRPASVLFLHSTYADHQQIQNAELEKMVKEYYEVEDYGSKKVDIVREPLEMKRARQILENTTVFKDDHYETGLLWKADDVRMPDSYPMALQRLKGVENKMKRDPQYAKYYDDAMKDFIQKKYARKLTEVEANDVTERTWYLPHFGVLNPNKPGKIRLVFDAAATVNNVSLNTQLLKGPDMNQPLIAVLSQFREGPVAVCADIKEMFCQIKVREDDRTSQRFLWRSNPSNEVDVYEMESMIFGASCSPTSAQFVKNLNAEKFASKYPDAADCVIRSHYVDDFVRSFDDEESAVKVTRQVIEIQKAASFELRGFMSNSRNVLAALSPDQEPTMLNLNIDKMSQTERILGMYWDSNTDHFVFQFKFHKVPAAVLNREREPTKREMLSLVMSIFDPFGILADFHVVAKVLLQIVWNTNVKWDEPIPKSLCQKWFQWQKELDEVKNLKVPRCYSLQVKSAETQLHTFVDASETAYAAVCYWRFETTSKVEVVFAHGKTRVAPKKPLSIPRLELQAAVLGVRLSHTVLMNHTIKPNRCYYWSDSKTLINWVKSGSYNYKPFVAHRINEIVENSSEDDWNWVPTKLNVADDATRAKFPVKFNPDSRWIKGPEFLIKSQEFWPGPLTDLGNPVKEELKSGSHSCLYTQGKFLVYPIMPDLKRFSNFHRLVRTMAWTRRFVYNLMTKIRKLPRISGELTASELNIAELILCRNVQQIAFARDYEMLTQKKPLEKQSDLIKLNPYVDDDGCIRINGRIDAATIVPLATRRPMILPKDHQFTRLMIHHYHRKLKHANHETVVCKIREKYWVPSLRQVLKSVVAQCQHCKILNAKPQQPSMGPLPHDRLAAYERPFKYVGLDYFGPINVAIGRRREKRWVALFTCLTYRAVHLELATDLSTDACILCIRNFVNLRGVPQRIRSDNGTNFVGIHKELLNVTDLFDLSQIQTECSGLGIEWIFNSPSDPSAGGSWERLVQSVKRSLNATLEDRVPREDTLRSLLLEAANIVNSRPLTHLPVECDEEEPLTPNHFLLGDVNSTQVPKPVDEKAMCLRKQWRIAQQLKNHFYKRWIAEYLPTLTRRCKWYKEVKPLKIGDLVIVCDDNIPRSSWPRGRIIETFQGKDGQVRTAVVKTQTNQLRRPAHKLAVLDVVNPLDGFTGVGVSRIAV